MEQALAVATGTAQLTIPLSGLRNFRVPLPTELEQAEIIRRVDAAFTNLDRLAAEARSAAALLDRLAQAALAKAFRGELVPQNPNDEPASVLLKHIRSGRAAEGKPASHRRRVPRMSTGAAP
jgi:type I restriction enzyme S subunit